MLNDWAKRHGVTPAALYELRNLLIGPELFTPGVAQRDSEAAIQAAIRVQASQQGWRLFRNNVGAGRLESGSFVRWGLCNDSKAMNESVKSGDLIGLRPVTITPGHVGQVIGQFVSVECKRAGWRFTGTDREVAQLKWLEIINGLGGYAKFSTEGI